MPKIRRRGLAQAGELPATLKRSSKEARRRLSRPTTALCRPTGRGIGPTGPPTPSSSGRSRNAATTGFPSSSPIPRTSPAARRAGSGARCLRPSG